VTGGFGVAQPTMEDVAKLAGVSRALVSLVIRESPKVSDHARRDVLAAAARLGYRPNLPARQLASRRTTTIGVLLDDLHNPFFAEVADGVLRAADRHGYRVLFSAGRRRPTAEVDAIESFLGHRVDGILLVSPRLGTARIEAAAAAAPVVVVGRTLTSDRIDTVTNDERVGVDLVVDHLVELGHERIVHIDGGRGAGSGPRRSAFRAAMARHGLGDRAQVVGGDFTELSGVRAVTSLLASGDVPTAIFAGNDLSAVGALDRLEEAGLRVPADISLVGYDNTSLAAMRHISLTTVHQPRVEMGELAFDTLIERIGRAAPGAAARSVRPSLVVRRTTAAPR